jgi:hypothetical protein
MALHEGPQKSEPEVIQTYDDQSGSITKATGPRTSAGKERSKRNALKHGIFSKVALLKDESRSEFDSLLTGLREDRQPEGTLEEALVEKLAILLWRYRRFLRAEAEDIQTVIENDLSFLPAHKSVLNHPDHLLRYETSIERSFDRTLTQLERLQQMRLGQPVLPKLEVCHSLS